MDNTLLHRKEKLIITTIDIINELGIQGLSTREIAKRQEISEATLFRHFDSKNDLMIAVLQYFSQYDTDIFQTTGLKELSPKDAIIFLISSQVEYYENYPAITSIIQVLDALYFDKVLREKVIEIRNSRSDHMRQLIENAQKAGIIDPNADTDNINDLFMGYIREICIKWRLSNFSFSLKEHTLTMIERLFDYFSHIKQN
jgi:AcrR family transcriptional regulator